ncbi:MAG: carboxylesterase family protein [Prevotella sp.]
MKKMGYNNIREMRDVTADELMRKAAECGYLHYYHTDNLFMPEQPLAIYESRRQMHVSLLVGGNSLESAPRDIFPKAWREKRLPTMQEALDVAAAIYGEENAKEMLDLYGIKKDTDILMQPGRALCNDYHIAYGTWRWADVHRRTGNAPVYHYYYSHPLSEENNMESATAIDSLWQQANRGACHGADIGYAMGTLSTERYHKWQPGDWFVSEIFNGYYVNFIKTGNPNSLCLPEWTPSNNSKVPPVMNIDVNCKMIIDSLEEKRYSHMKRLHIP